MLLVARDCLFGKLMRASNLVNTTSLRTGSDMVRTQHQETEAGTDLPGRLTGQRGAQSHRLRSQRASALCADRCAMQHTRGERNVPCLLSPLPGLGDRGGGCPVVAFVPHSTTGYHLSALRAAKNGHGGAPSGVASRSAVLRRILCYTPTTMRLCLGIFTYGYLTSRGFPAWCTRRVNPLPFSNGSTVAVISSTG